MSGEIKEEPHCEICWQKTNDAAELGTCNFCGRLFCKQCNSEDPELCKACAAVGT